MTGLLAIASGAAFNQIAALRNWPGLVRKALGTVDILLGLAFIACLIIAASIQPKSDHAKFGEPR